MDENLTWNLKWQLMNNISWFNGFHAKLTSSPLNHDPKNLPLVYIYIYEVNIKVG